MKKISQSQPYDVGGSMPAIGADGTLYVIYTEGHGYTETAYVKLLKSTDGGASFSTPTTIGSYVSRKYSQGGISARNIPVISTSPIESNKIYVAWFEKPLIGDSRILFTRSVDGGNTWATPFVPTTTPAGHNFFPWLSVGIGGDINLAFMNLSSYLNCYIGTSMTGNDDFAFLKITDVNESVFTGDCVGECEFSHHYMGAVSSNSAIHTVWTDFRNTTGDIYFAKHPAILVDPILTGNSQRKTVRQSNGTLHGVLSASGSIWYLGDPSGTSHWATEKVISDAGTAGYPNICERTPSGAPATA